INRTGGSDSAISVQYVVTIPGTLSFKNQAIPGTDFQGALSGTVSFNAGETQKTLSFAIPSDNLVEDTKSFVVTLRNPSGGATLGTQTIATVNISDTNLPIVPDS